MPRLPHIAIIGRPNVGKSTLFNRLIGRRQAIVDPTPGVTRDWIEGVYEWEGRHYKISDLAGWDERPINPFASETVAQIWRVAELADLIFLVVDGKEGLTSWDKELAERLRILGTPVIVVVNKCDNVQSLSRTNEFHELGMGDPIGISATHNFNLDELLDLAAALTEGVETEEAGEEKEPGIPVALIGRQNVGKSTLFNALVKDHRAIVSEIPGTTRDAIDTAIEIDGTRFVFIDTAGMKRRTKVGEAIDYYAMRRTEQAIRRCEVALLLIDCLDGVTETDTKVASLIQEAERACIIVATKWDVSEDAPGHRAEFEKHALKKLHFLWFSPIIFTSGLHGEGIGELLDSIVKVYAEYNKRVPTASWNKALVAAVEYRPAPTNKGKQLKLNYITQTEVAPPRITVFVNQPDFLKSGYKRYLEKHFRHMFGFEGAPLIFQVRRKSPKRESNP
jgi:GTP-binding protein